MQLEVGVGLFVFDMIDLYGIFIFLQVIFLVLRVDEFFWIMCFVILQVCSGFVMFVVIIVQDEGSVDWCVVVSGDLENGVMVYILGILFSGIDFVFENVILYCI